MTTEYNRKTWYKRYIHWRNEEFKNENASLKHIRSRRKTFVKGKTTIINDRIQGLFIIGLLLTSVLKLMGLTWLGTFLVGSIFLFFIIFGIFKKYYIRRRNDETIKYVNTDENT